MEEPELDPGLRTGTPPAQPGPPPSTPAVSAVTMGPVASSSSSSSSSSCNVGVGGDGGHFPHGLIGLSPSGFSETVRNSISTFASNHGERKPRKGRSQISSALEKMELEELDDKDDKDCNYRHDEHEPNKPQPSHKNRALETKKPPLHLFIIPPELQLMILSHLDFADIERLRRTCKQLRALANPRQIRMLMGPARLYTQLLTHCKSCLVYDPFRSHLILGSPNDPAHPLSNLCVDCAMRADDFRIRVGRKVLLANLASVSVCRWCGWPVIEGAAFSNEQFHRPCYKAYNDTLLVFFTLGWIQLAFGITGAALAWRFFRHVVIVFAPTVTSFLLLWLDLAFLISRGNLRNTYGWTLCLELIILGLWIPPVYYIATGIAASLPGTKVSKSTISSLVLFCLNILFRLFNVVGNMILICSYDKTRYHRPNLPLWRRILNPIACLFIFWTYPQALERRYRYQFMVSNYE